MGRGMENVKMTQRRRWIAALVAAPMAAAAMAAAAQAPAHAEPENGDETVVEIEPSSPMPVPQGAFGYLATRGATLWLAQQDAPGAIAALPVPHDYRVANDALADQFDRELEAAVRTPGACVQFIIAPLPGGMDLFDYGIWSVDRQYCPR